MIELNNETSSSEEQVIDESNNIFQDYLTYINSQLSSVNRSMNETDYLTKFYTEFLNQKSMDSVFDRSIMIDPNLTDYDKEALRTMRDKLNQMFTNNLGLTFLNGNVSIYYTIYDIFVLHFVMYFVMYLNGLQKLDESYADDIPNWKDLSYLAFLDKKNGTTTLSAKGAKAPFTPQDVNDYLTFILQDGIVPECYFEIIMLESSSYSLDELVTESVNQRIDYDYEFFRLKLEKILSSEDTRSYVIQQFIETNIEISTEDVVGLDNNDIA